MRPATARRAPGSSSVSSDIYKGPSPASEAETITLQTWSRVVRFAKVLDYHSYGREVVYGFACLNHPFQSWMQKEAAWISNASGYGGTTRVPSQEGEHQQWQFSRMGAYAFLVETNTEFQPPYGSAVAEAAAVWPGILAVLDRPISVHGHVTDALTGAPVDARVEIVNVTFTNDETNASGGRYGEYHLFLPPGTWDVRFAAPNYATVVSRVTVGQSSSTDLEVQMKRHRRIRLD